MKYPFTVYYATVEGHSFWVAKCPALKGCVGQGETMEEAVAELEANEAEWIATAKECGIEVPSIPVIQEDMPSGKFTVRVSPVVHQAAVECARKQCISLNQYVNDAIVAYNSQNKTLDAVKRAITNQLGWLGLGSRSLSDGRGTQQVSMVKPLIARAAN